MKKILIVSLFGLGNYGNRLQNYAACEIVKKLGYIPESLRVAENDHFIIHILKIVKRYMCHYLGIRKFPYKKSFKKFNKKHIKMRTVKFNKIYTDKFKRKYEYVFLGGDQIWGHFRHRYLRDDFWFGSMLDKSRRVTLCPSFGGTWVAPENREEFKRYLEELEHISIREESGAKIIKDLTGRDATVVIDPVMALTREDWEKVFDKNKYAGESYVLCCFLGEDDSSVNKMVDKIASGNNIKRLYRKTPESEEGPDGFLSLIHNAKVICTDSFHCAAFSILFKRPLIVFDRAGFDATQNSRLSNLLSKFDLCDRHISRIEESQYYDCNYNHVDEILEKERKIFYDFLKLTVKDN